MENVTAHLALHYKIMDGALKRREKSNVKLIKLKHQTGSAKTVKQIIK